MPEVLFELVLVERLRDLEVLRRGDECQVRGGQLHEDRVPAVRSRGVGVQVAGGGWDQLFFAFDLA